MPNLADKHLHIVSFNVPYPPDYGGVIDVFYKIKALHSLGVKIHLHCFYYGREKAEELNRYCETVSYYERKKFYQAIYKSVPFIVGSRQSGELLEHISHDDYPILFEGLHTCFYLAHKAIRHKQRAVRMHNVEWEYYRSLKEAERNYLFKFYYFAESEKLKKFEDELQHATAVFTISKSDYEYYRQHHEHISYIPAFHSNEQMVSKEGFGDYVLYHGNLSVVENHQAALYIIKKIAEGSPRKFVIAGREPLPALHKEIKKHENVELIGNPDFDTISALIRDAHINLLPTFQNTGIKLKLLNALWRGRFCLVNSKMVQNTGLEDVCIVEDNPNIAKRLIENLFAKKFTQEHINARTSVLEEKFSNKVSAQKIIDVFWGRLTK
jgi:hypothetical protein